MKAYGFLFTVFILFSCSKTRDINVTRIGDSDPMYKLDQKVEMYRKQHELSRSNTFSYGPGVGISFSAFGSRGDILRKMHKANRNSNITETKVQDNNYAMIGDTLLK